MTDKLNISRTMDLGQLAERMGDDVFEPEATAMRGMLTANAPAYGWTTTNDVEDADWFRMLEIAARMDAETSRVHIEGQFRALDGTEAGCSARCEYAAALRQGKSHEEAEVIASNVLERHGDRVNQHGGASFAFDESTT